MRMRIILASASPRRQALLRQLGADFEVRVSAVDEDIAERDPHKHVTALAAAKASDVALSSPADAIVIGADTIVYIDGCILGKPADAPEAYAMLKRLSGRAHEVYTGLALVNNATGECTVSTDRTVVYMRELSDAEITAYVSSGSSIGKAGGYGIQDRAALFVNRIEGDFFTVVGLPVYRLAGLLNAQANNIDPAATTTKERLN